jgi:hypothetical protein
MTAAPLDPMAMLAGLVLDDEGTMWGDVAEPWQRADAAAILLGTAPEDVRLHFQTRPKGGSKTTDQAAVLLVAMLTQAPRGATLHAYASDADQATILLDALRALAERSGLLGLLDVQAGSATVKATGVKLRVESADSSSAHGRMPWFIVADELANWRETREAVALWEAATAGLPKVRTSRLVVLTTAGDPSHWAAKVIDNARASERWRVSEVPGPLPWVSEADLDVQRTMLPPSRFAQLHLNVWTASEDRLVTAEDLAACVTLRGTQPYDPRYRYQLGLDLGWTNDATVLTVAHAEQRESGRVIVLDRIDVLQGSREHPVQLAEVQRLAERTSKLYGSAPLRVDPREAVAMAQALRDRGMTVDDRQLTVQSVGKIGGNLHRLLAEHRVALPNDPDLLGELASVRLRKTSLGELRLDHDAGGHDDRAMSLGLAALALTERDDSDRGGFSNPHEVAASMGIATIHGPGRATAGAGVRLGTSLPDPYAQVAIRGPLADVLAAQQRQTEAQRQHGVGLVVPGSANDPTRVIRSR